MKMTRGTAALAGVLALACGLVAWEWFVHVGERPGAQPVRQIAAAPTASAAPVVYVPKPVNSPAAARTPSARGTPSAAPAASAPATPPATSQPSASPAPGVKLTPYAANRTAVSTEPMVAVTLAPSAVSAVPVREPPDAPPRILSMALSTPVAHGGDVVSGTVETTSNVASVEARIAGYSSSMQKVGVGKFALSYRVPNLPFFLHRTYTIEVIARNTRGDAVTSSLPITIR